MKEQQNTENEQLSCKDDYFQGADAIGQIEFRRLPFGKAREPRAIARARSYLEENYMDNVLLADVAAFAYLSRFHLIRVFKKHTGLSPHAYLEHLRVRRAKELLRAGKPIIETAHELGFVDQSHLTRTFKKFTGTTPGQWAVGSGQWTDSKQLTVKRSSRITSNEQRITNNE